MAKTLSKNYLLNRYSYILFCIFIALYTVYLKTHAWRIRKDDIIVVCIVTLVFILWIFIYGTFHFNRQVKVERIDYRHLKITKFFESKILDQNDLEAVKFFRITDRKLGWTYYKVLMKTRYGELFGFSYQPEKSKKNDSLFYDVKTFYEDTESFWGLITIDKVHMARNLLECN